MQAVVFYVQNEYLLTKTAMQFAPWFFHTNFCQAAGVKRLHRRGGYPRDQSVAEKGIP